MDELLQLELLPLTNARRESIGGREYVVATARILREQVLSGSDGPLFYPLDEISQDVGVWNGYPLTAKHPQVVLADGKIVNASARSPKVAHAYQIGTVYNDRVEGQERLVDAYFDVQNSNRIDSRLVPAVLAGKSINVSTGIFTGKVAYSGTHNGRSYTHKVKGIKPDHLAVLMDEKGACSVGDGCGINVNADKPRYPERCPYCNTMLEIDPDSGICNRCNKKVPPLSNGEFPPTEEPNVNKDQMVQWLTANCDCWKGDKAKVLNSLDEEQLKGLKANAEGAKGLVLVVNGLKEAGVTVTDPAKVKDAVANMTAEQKKKWAEDEEEQKKKMGMMKTNQGGEDKTATAPTTNEQVLAALKSLPEAEVLKMFPTLNATVETAKKVVDERRVEVINKLVANIKDEGQKKAQILKYKDASPEVLNMLLEAQQIAGGAGGSPPANNQTEDERFLANFFAQGKQGTKKEEPTTNRGEVLMPCPIVSLD